MSDNNNSHRREVLDRGSGVGIMSASSSSDNKSSCCNNNNISSPLIPRILSGSLGSIVTALAVTPLEVVKIRQQAAGAQNNIIAPTSFRGIKVEPCAKGW